MMPKRLAGKKHRSVMNTALLVELLLILAYTVTVLIMYYRTGLGEPTILTSCIFGLATAENGFMALIKTTKEKAGPKAAPPEEREEPPDAGE